MQRMNVSMKHTAFLFALILLFLCSCGSIRANDGVFYVNGNHLVPIHETDIALTKEVLTIGLCDDGYARVDVQYELDNPGTAKTVVMGFEANAPYNDDVPFSPQGIHPYIADFTVNMNGEKLAYMNAVVKSDFQVDCEFQPLDLKTWKAYGDVKMKDGWPMMSVSKNNKLTTPSIAPSERLAYQWHANYQDVFGFPILQGMRVYGHNVSSNFKSLWEVPNLYLKKFEGETFVDTLRMVITAKADGNESGFVIMGRDYYRLSVELQNEQFVLKRIICKNADEGALETGETIAMIKARKYGAGAKVNYECRVDVRIQCDKGAVCHLAYSADGKSYISLPISFQAREGKWIGAKYGVFSIAPKGASKGWVDLTLH